LAVRPAYVAFDLGAESGRAMLASLDAGRATLEEVHRFPNSPQRLPSGYHWNLLQLWAELVEGLRRAHTQASKREWKIVSVGVDTWGVDFGLLGKSGQLLGLPFAYRDPCHPPAMQQAFDTVGPKPIYDATGIQFLPFNTLFQLISRQQAEPQMLDGAARLLHMPDLLNYFFSGRQVHEATIASTSQMIDPSRGTWDTELLSSLGLGSHFLGEVVPAGTRVAALRTELAEDAGLPGDIEVVAIGGHDTASAVAAVPAEGPSVEGERGGWAYLSSGTWSLMGVELDEPKISDQTRELGFTNERGVSGKVRFLKNISGLWLVQQVRQDLEKQGRSLDYPELTKLAEQAEPFRTLVDPDDPPFVAPGEMIEKLRRFAEKSGQPVPDSPGRMVRCCLESLALCYRDTLESLETLLGCRFERLHVVGGGGKNTLLQQMTADALGREVTVGPYEATATGNALTQAMGMGEISDLSELRSIVRRSFEVETYAPSHGEAYEDQLHRYRKLRAASA